MCLPRVRMPARTINPHLGRRLPVLAACRVTWRAEQKEGARVTSGSPKPAPQMFLSRPSWPFGFHGAITQSSPDGGLGKRFPEKNLPEVWFITAEFPWEHDRAGWETRVKCPSLSLPYARFQSHAVGLSGEPGPWADANDTAPPAGGLLWVPNATARGMVISTLTLDTRTSHVHHSGD